MQFTIITSIFLVLIGLAVLFIPTGIAFLRGNIYKSQTLKYQLLLIVLGVIFSIITGLFGLLGTVIGFIGTAIAAIWSLVSFGGWIYILINAVKDTEMTVLKRFGINL